MLKNRFYYFFLVILALAFTLVYSGSVSYVVLYSILLMPVASVLTAFYFSSSLLVTQKLNKSGALKEEEIVVSIDLQNRSIFYFPKITLFFKQDLHIGFNGQLNPESFVMNPREKLNLRYRFYGKYRGSYEIGIDFIEIYDYLGIIKFKKFDFNSDYLCIYPNVTENIIFFQEGIISEQGYSIGKNSDDSGYTSDVKKYSYTESMKRIHWKLSAKKNELLVKNYSSNSLLETLIILESSYEDKNEANLKKQDKICECTASFLHYCIANDMPYSLLTYIHGSQTKVSSSDGLDYALQVLANLDFSEKTSFSVILKHTISYKQEASYILVFIRRVDTEIMELLINASLFGHSLILLVSDADGFSVHDKEKASEYGINMIKLN